jgi:hypothetical protein
MLKALLAFFLYILSVNLYGQVVSVSTYQPLSLFQWQDNYIMVVVENTSCANIVVKADKGKLITNNNCRYIYSISDTSVYEVKLSVGIRQAKNVKWVEEKFYRIRPYSTPWVRLGFKTEGTVSKSLLLKNPAITVPVTNNGQPREDPKIHAVTSYSIRVSRMDSVIYQEQHIPGSALSAGILEVLKSRITSNDSIIVTDVLLKLYEKESRKGNDIRLKLLNQ